MRHINPYIIPLALFALLMCGAASCSKSKSYSEMLRDEEKATNWWLANQKIENEVPADSVFQTGENAPFYKLDEDGYIYMQVINPGNSDKKAATGQQVFFRYMRTNILDLYLGYDAQPTGNASDMGNANSLSFRFDDLNAASSLKFGSGIQAPLRYLGLDCEVNLVLRSYYGFQGETGQCQPFVYNIKYYPAYY